MGQATKVTKLYTEPPAVSAHMPSTDGVYLIGELADAVGLEPKTIRYYELEGLLKPTKHGRFKFYGQQDVEHLTVIKKLRKYGFSIEKLRTIIALEGPNLKLGQHKNPRTADVIKDQFTLTSVAVAAAQSMLAEFEQCVSGLRQA
jgi:DNA-binding transcriptional MerR regulator